MVSRFRWIILALWLVSLAACAAPAVSTPTSVPVATTHEPERKLASTLPGTAATETPSSVLDATSGVTGGGIQVPTSCDLLISLVGAYMGGVAKTQSLGTPQHLSCEFANANASNIIVVNIGVGGTVTAFDTLRSTSAKGGRTVTPISELGASAFSVSKNGVPGGVSVLTAQGLIYVVESNISIDEDKSLIEQLMKLP